MSRGAEFGWLGVIKLWAPEWAWGRGGFPHEFNLRRGKAVGLVDEVAQRAL